jgi:hypothetical protein
MSDAPFDRRSQPLVLSTSGQTRRDAMLAELQDNMSRLHAACHVRRRAASLAVPIIVLGGLVWLCWPERAPSAPLATHSRPSVLPKAALNESVGGQPQRAFHVARVHTDLHAVDRLRANAVTTAARLSDGDLIGTLAAIDRPTGLVRSGDRIWLTRVVTDESAHGG